HAARRDVGALPAPLAPRGPPPPTLPPTPTPPEPRSGAGGGMGRMAGVGGAAMPGGAPAPGQPMMQTATPLASQFDAGARNAFANPMGTTSVEQLNRTAQALRAEAQQRFNEKKDATANEITNYAAALEQARDLVLRVDEQRKPAGKGAPVRAQPNEGPSVTYPLSARLTVPSRSDEQVIEVARIDLRPDYFYKA